jgi:dTDP-4-dehydrorhamnose reductase
VKILVLGGGQIGSAVVRCAPSQHQVVAIARSQLDIVDARSVERTLLEVGANWIVNAAAYTGVDNAEGDTEQASAVNDTAVASLAESAARAHSRVLHLSTDFVFDGASSRAYLPTDKANPLSVYGKTKLAGEHNVISREGGVVLRTSWVHASIGRNFVLTMLKLMSERREVSVVIDQIGSPTWAASVASAIWGLIEIEAPGGIYHWTDLGVASWYDFAVAIQEEALERGLLMRAVPILPIASAAYPTAAKRPKFSVLDTANTRSILLVPARHWRHNLRLMLNELRAA